MNSTVQRGSLLCRLRMEGLPALTLWECVVDVFSPGFHSVRGLHDNQSHSEQLQFIDLVPPNCHQTRSIYIYINISGSVLPFSQSIQLHWQARHCKSASRCWMTKVSAESLQPLAKPQDSVEQQLNHSCLRKQYLQELRKARERFQS